MGVDGSKNPMHAEDGFIRVRREDKDPMKPINAIELLVADPTGSTTIYEGILSSSDSELVFDFTSSSTSLTPSSKPIQSSRRTWRFVLSPDQGSAISWVATLAMEAVGQPLTHHIESSLSNALISPCVSSSSSHQGSAANVEGKKRVTGEELDVMIQNVTDAPFELFDVREADEIERTGKLNTKLVKDQDVTIFHAPLGRVIRMAPDVEENLRLYDESAPPLVFYCGGGNRSLTAANFLSKLQSGIGVRAQLQAAGIMRVAHQRLAGPA